MARVRRRAKEEQRVRQLIALDAANVMKRLTARSEEMISLFSRLRDRGPMLETVKSWFGTVTFAELALLDPPEQREVNAFYELLGEVRWYLQYTEEMPTQLRARIGQFMGQLEESYRALTAVIGPPDAEGAPVVDAEVVR